MGEHAHHAHHMPGMNHEMNDTTVSPLAATVSTLLQTVMTTVMSHTMHQHHHHAGEETSAGHSRIFLNDSPTSAPSVTGEHVHHGQIQGHAEGSESHNMPMYFHSDVSAIILFKDWNVSTTEGLIGSVIGIFLLAMLYEGLKFFREFMFKKYFTSLEYSSVSVLGDDGKTVTEVHKVVRNRMFSWPHALQTVLHVIQMVLSYFLMLIFMTYNVWLCIGVVLGAGAGYFLFGWKKATVVDITEHCH